MLNEWSQTPFTYKRISLLKAFDQKITVCAGKLAPKLNQISKKVQWESIFPQDVFFSAIQQMELQERFCPNVIQNKSADDTV